MKKTVLFSVLIIFCVMLAFTFTGCGTTAVASGECGDSAKWSLDENGVLTITGSGEMEPTKVRPWSDYNDDIVEIVIEDGITSIKGLDGLYNVKKVTIGNDVKTIAGLSGLYALKSIVIPEGVETIAESAFGNCAALYEITLPRSLKSIERSAFVDCESLSKINISDIASWCAVDLAEFFASPFCYGAKLFVNGEAVSELAIPADVTTIGKYQFCGLDSIVRLEISNGVTSIESNAFRNCGNIVSVKLGSGVGNIASDAFYNCTKVFEVINTSSLSLSAGSTSSELTSRAITVHNGASKIIENDGWLLLPTEEKNYIVGYVGASYILTIPSEVNGVTYTDITNYAFSGNERLVSVTIPSTINSIGYKAFKDCNALCEVVNNSSVEFDRQSAMDNPLALNIISVHDGESRIVEKNGWLFLPATAEEYVDNLISGHALVGYNGIANASELTLPADYNGQSYHIYDYAFSGVDGITSVTLSNGVVKVGNYAFSNCFNLESVTFGSNLQEIGYYAFNHCAIKSLAFPSSLKKIGRYAFYDNRELSGTVTIPSSVIEIEGYAFCLDEDASHTTDFGVIFEAPNGWNEYEAEDLNHGNPVTFGDNALVNRNKIYSGKYFVKT